MSIVRSLRSSAGAPPAALARLSVVRTLLFDLSPADDSGADRVVAERIRLVIGGMPALLALRALGAAVLLWSIGPAAALTLVLAVSVALDAGFVALLASWHKRKRPPYAGARLACGFALAQGLAWAAATMLAGAGAGAIATAALLAVGALAIVVLLPLPLAALAAFAAAVASWALWLPHALPLLAASGCALLWLSFVQARRGVVAVKHEIVQEWHSQRAERLLAEFEESGRGWFWETGADGSLTYVSGHLARALGCEESDLADVPFTKLMSVYDKGADEDLKTERSLGFHLSAQLPFADLTVRANTKDELWWSISGRPIHDAYGRFFGFRGIGTDLTEMRRSEAELSRLARYDSLTGLANRGMMRRTLDEALRGAARRKRRCSLFVLDLDRFKIVNDTMGHPVGDSLLRLVALRLADVVGDRGQIGRLGGDEFEAVFPELEDEDELADLAEKLIASVSRPYQIANSKITIGVSVGIAISKFEGSGADELIRDADLALYAAKAAGRGTFRFFEPEMHSDVQDRQVLEADLREAIKTDGLRLAYQPVVNPTTNAVVGFEALLRWQHPTRGAISPALFVPLAEEVGLINPIGEWVLRTACFEAAKWPAGVRVAVNLSPLQFAEPTLPALVISALAASELPANRLELEITEGVLLNDSAATDEMFAKLQAIGVRLALDDFGTGYSSLSYLRKAPFNKIKIDQSFVRGAGIPGSRNAAIIRAIVSLAADLGMETTAEGAETHDELDLIKSLGVSLVQGYIFGKPMPGEDALKLVSGDQPVAPDGLMKRRPARHGLIRSAMIHMNGAQIAVRLRNISAGGAMVECTAPIDVDGAVELDINEGEPLAGRVRWRRDGRIGIQFEPEFDLKRLSQLPRKAGPANMLKPQYLDAPSVQDAAAAKERFTAKDARRG